MGRHAPQGRANLNAHVCAEFLLPAYSGGVAQRTTLEVQFSRGDTLGTSLTNFLA